MRSTNVINVFMALPYTSAAGPTQSPRSVRFFSWFFISSPMVATIPWTCHAMLAA